MTINKINTPLTDNATAGKINEIIDYYAAKDLDNLSSSGYSVLNDSKVLKTGLSVGNDSTIYGQIAQMYTDPRSVSKTTVELVNGSIVGNPTISNAKVLDNSTCDNSNYVEFSTADFITENAWKITVPFPTSSWNGNSGIIYIVGGMFASALQVKLNYSNNAFTGVAYKLSSNGSSYFSNTSKSFSGYTVPFTRDASDVSLLSVEFTGSSYVISTSINSTEDTVDAITSSSKLYNSVKSGLRIGVTMDTGFGSYGAGYIDLSKVKVEVGNSTVIQGSTDVVPISYVESIEGVKITDSTYRNSFNNMYSSKGYVPYFTIDTTSENYTLPMGEIYGMLNKIDESTVHLSGYENITGVKTFIGEKRIRFEQGVSSDKVGFTLLNPSSKEIGSFEYRPSTIDGKSLLSLGNWGTSSSTTTYVGFRMHYGNGTSATGNTYNIVAPLVGNAQTDFNIGSAFAGTTFYLPLGFTDGTTMVSTSSTGKVDLSPLLPSEDFIKDSHALETGAVHDVSSVYSWITRMYGGTIFELDSFGTVGSPTISNDGTMSSSNKSNCVYIPDASFLAGDDWELKIPNPDIRNADTTYVATGDPTKSNMTESANPSQSTDPGFHSLFFRLRSDGTIYIKLSSDGSTWDISSGDTASYNASNTEYFIIRFHKNEGVYKVWVVESGSPGEIEKITINSSSNLYLPQSGLKLYIGGLSTSTSSYIQDVDLTKVEARVQGQVVFSPVTVVPYTEGTDTYNIGGNQVEIPYHLSTTGSKVTTAEYRNNIQSVYEQQGYAPYFTFDTSDNSYTLPMGEIYGMMSKTADSKIQSFSDSIVTHTANTAVGSATQPVYIASNGAATATTYSLAKSVPSDAVFTDTTYSAGTGLSLSGTTFNHSNSVTAGTAGTSSATSGASLDVPYITYDAQGHITATGTHTHTITGFLTQSDVTSTYTPSGTAPVNGQAVNSAISTAISSVYKPAGSVAFANLPTLSSSVLGNVYDVTDSFTTDSRFVEGTGNTYPAGTNVVVVDISTTSTPDYKFDVLAGFVDLSGYQLANTAVTHTASTAAGSATQPVYVNSSGVATATTYELNKTVPSDAVFTDTLNTAGSTDTSSQIYLIGATEQAANPQTYSHDTVYVDTNGRLHAASPATSANDTTLATTYWVTGKGYAADSAVVHLADTETITGNKTFSGTVDLGSSATATTPASTDNSTNVATTAYVKNQNYVAVTIRNWD